MRRKDLTWVSLAFAAGCTDPIVGDWNYQRVATYGDCTETLVADLEVSENLDAEMLVTFSYAGDCYYGDGGVYLYTGDVFAFETQRSRSDHAHYRIEVANGNTALELQCTLNGAASRLSCDPPLDLNSWVFTR